MIPSPTQPRPLTDQEAALFEAFLDLTGDIQAIAAKCGIRSWQVVDWSSSPAIAPRLDRLKELHQHTAYTKTSRALIGAIDTLQELLRTSDPIERRKTAGQLSRLFTAQTSSPRKRDCNTPPGRIHNLPDSSPASSSLDASVPHASIPSPQTFGLTPEDIAGMTPAEKRRLVSFPSPDGTFFTYDPKAPLAHVKGDPLAFLRPSRPSGHAPTNPNDPGSITDVEASGPAPSRPAPASDEFKSSSPLDSSTSAISPAAPSANSNPDFTNPATSDPRVSAQSAASSDPAFSSLVNPDSPSLSPPDPEGDIYRQMRPPPIFFPDPYEFPSPDPDDATPFPKHDPSLYPAPSPETKIPETVIDLVNTRELTVDQCLAIARLKDPWYCLPKDGRAKPHRRKINKDGELRRAYDKICYALIRARNVVSLALTQQWEMKEFQRVLAERGLASSNEPNSAPPLSNTS